MAFEVKDTRVTVAGAARSGIAAAELLARRGARVTLSEAGPAIADADRLRGLGVALEVGGHTRDTFVNAALVVLSPGVPPPHLPPNPTPGAENATMIWLGSVAAMTSAWAAAATRGVRPRTPATALTPIEPETSSARTQRFPVGVTFPNAA